MDPGVTFRSLLLPKGGGEIQCFLAASSDWLCVSCHFVIDFRSGTSEAVSFLPVSLVWHQAKQPAELWASSTLA